jgi:signal transduction histidine kinase
MAESYPIPPDEEERIQALHSYGILDTAEEQEFDDVATLAAAICDAPIALVSLVDRDRQWFKARVGIDERETSRDISFCAHAIMEEDLMEVEDATADERFRENPLVLQNPSIRFYAGVPLRPDHEHAFGTLCVIDRKRRKLTASQRAALESLARQASALIELRRTNAELQRLSAQKNAFLRMAGHDLRNPLSYLLGVSTLLSDSMKADEPVDEESIELIQHLPERARYMANLIDTFLDVQAIEDGGVRLERRDVDLVHLVRSILDDYARYAESRGVRVDLDAPADPVKLSADAARVRQIVENLLSNAIKFSERGHALVAIVETDDRVVINVVDSGPGIKESERENLFVPYAELTTQAVSGDQSRGLGLSICKFLAELHGGSMEADNNEGGGARFTVRLPRR